ncbi:MAG: S41 family peptidase [bacterium]
MRSLSTRFLLLTGLMIIAGPILAEEEPPYARWPDIQGNRVVFTSDDDLWIASLDGGSATRLTSHVGQERNAVFSADGKWIAFTGQMYGNYDVFVIPASGGEPRRLTYWNLNDEVAGWTSDGKVLFQSDRQPPFRAVELYAVDPNGGFPEKLPYLRASHIAWEPGGKRVALVRNNLAWVEWNRYHGGQADKIWIGDPTVPEFTKVSHGEGNESWPMWHGNGRIYYVADYEGRENLWSMMPDGSDLRQETNMERFDVRYPRMRGNLIVFQNGADLAIFNVTTRELRKLELNVPSDLVQASRRFLDPNEWVDGWSLSAKGERLVVSSRGEVYTLPVKGKGLIRRWTRSSGSREQSVHFVGKGGTLLAITDAGNEMAVIKLDKPLGEMVPVEKDNDSSWKDLVVPSPDGNYAALATGDQRLWLIDLEKGTRKQIDRGGWEFTEIAWSPDSRWIAYTHVEGEDEITILYIYDTQTGKNVRVSDPHFNTSSPAWDFDGRFLYCVSERNFDYNQDYSRGLFTFKGTNVLALYRLRNNVPSPSLPHGDVADDGLAEAPWLTKAGNGKKKEKKKDDDTPEPVVIEFEGLSQRMEALSEKAGNYGGLTGVEDKLYFEEYDDVDTVLKLYDLAKGESESVMSGISEYEVSQDRSTIVVRAEKSWYWGKTGSASLDKESDNTVSTEGWELEVQPQLEWQQILHEAWRQEREFFYDKFHNGVDWNEVLTRYGSLLKRVRTRDDLNDLIREIQAEQSTGHSFIGRGDLPKVDEVDTGLLGVEFEPDAANDVYRIVKVYSPEPGSPNGASPLLVADPTAGPGTYLLAVDGRPAKASQNIYRLFEGKAGVPVALLLNDKPTRKDAREVIVTPISSEYQLRLDSWIAEKRDYVMSKSDGKVGFVYLPDMSGRGMWRWGRDYYPQRQLPGLIVDDRYNSGGNVSEYFLKEMAAPIHTLQSSRYGGWETKPHGSFFGHAALLINGTTFSDGETFANAIKTTGFAPLIGTRTSGGGVWWWARRPLLDRGLVVVPEFASWSPTTGKWVVEGTGISPDVELVNDPASELRGEDRQLDKAIETVLKKIEEEPHIFAPRPERGPDAK